MEGISKSEFALFVGLKKSTLKVVFVVLTEVPEGHLKVQCIPFEYLLMQRCNFNPDPNESS